MLQLRHRRTRLLTCPLDHEHSLFTCNHTVQVRAGSKDISLDRESSLPAATGPGAIRVKEVYSYQEIGTLIDQGKQAVFTCHPRDSLRQPAMLDPRDKDKSYPLPFVAPGQEARIVDADCEWEMWNGRRGIVTAYSFFTGLHTIEVEASGPLLS